MKNRRLTYVIGACALIPTILIGWIYSSYKGVLTTSGYSANQDSLIVCAENFTMRLRTTGVKFPNIWIKSDSVFQLGYLNKPTLVFYFSEDHCSKCISQELRLIKEQCTDIDDKIILLVSFRNYKTLQIFKQTERVDYPTYLVARRKFNWFPNQLNRPYYFILNSNMTVSDFYLSDELYPDLSKQYLKGINRLLTN